MEPGNAARIRELEVLIRRHQDLYYNGEAEISDEEFDTLWDELAALDPESPILRAVGRDSIDGWPKAAHLMPMGSQNKATSPEEFIAWALKYPTSPCLVQYKLDGASLELQYRGGRILRAVTRGDGHTGDEITANVLAMRGLVRNLPEVFTGAVRGEVIMTRAVHLARHPDKANCRNAANGVMRRKDGLGAEDLEILCYDALHKPESGSGEPVPFTDEAQKLAWLARMGFTVVHTEQCRTPGEVIAYRAKVMDLRPALDYDIDGLVIKGLQIDEADAAKARPERQIAFKFSPEEAISTLREVEWSQSGATFTPIGIVDPVRLAGTVVKRANLCNTNLIAQVGLKIGSRIVITKRGEIIPKIESLVENPEDATTIPVPTTCSCGSTLVDEGTRLYCPNEACPSRSLHRLQKWLAVLAVDDFGPAIIERLFVTGRVRTIADLYTLEAAELSLYERMGDTLAAKILRNLFSRETISLPRFVAALDIENIGELLVERVVQAGYNSLAKLRVAKAEELSGIFGIGDKTAAAIVGGLSALGSGIDAILATGKIRIEEAGSAGPLTGKSFCFTGELASMKRAEAENLVKSLGGSIKSSVTKDLSYLVTNDPDSGSGKNKKARSLGIAVIGETDFLSLMHRPVTG